jgi:hypothetical protein
MSDFAEANRIARRANRIAVIALALSTVFSLGALAVSILQTQYVQDEARQMIARQVVRDVDVFISTDDDSKPVFKFINRSPLPVRNFHVHTKTATGEGRNYRIGDLEGCRSLGLYINRDIELLLGFSFTDPYGQSWSRDAAGALTAIASIDTTAETVPAAIDFTSITAPSFDITELSGCE